MIHFSGCQAELKVICAVQIHVKQSLETSYALTQGIILLLVQPEIHVIY